MRVICAAVIITLCTISVGVSFAIQSKSTEQNILSVLRVGVLPDEDPEVLRKRYAPILKHLSAKTGLDTRLIMPSNYSELVRMLGNKEVDLAYFGGFTFLLAHTFHNAEPLVMRYEDNRFTSWFLVKGSDTSREISDFKNKSLAFGSRLSTSGHLMPRYFMSHEMQLVPENFFSEVNHSGAHDETAYLVRDGKFDLGVANSQVISSMIRDGRLKENDLRVLWETPPYSDYVWAVSRHLQEKQKTQVRDVFLELNLENSTDNQILSSLGTRGFIPAGIREFEHLEQIAASLGMLESSVK